MIKRLEHVGVFVQDMERSIHFYQEAFGLLVRRREFISPQVELCFLYFEESPEVEVELVCGPSIESSEGLVNHLAFRVTNIEAELNRLEQLGAELVDRAPRTILGNVKIAFMKGPNGEKLELVERE
ncbi:VOC family protein [Ammoniphilus sp. YIM 78166]|uniref:VOC family protein n=1 Tax=Ammoniphilus sp. YIM 78166 TaxID=1644106 RepID=UPI0014322E6D|nr:VOC family protein [Ammoniphilus sp. YIM 78166]